MSRIVPKETRRMIAADYSRGDKMDVITDCYGVSAQTVKRIAREEGCKRRPNGGKRRYDDAKIAAIKADLDAGMSQKDVQDKHHVSRQAILRALGRGDAARPRRFAGDRPTEEQIIAWNRESRVYAMKMPLVGTGASSLVGG